MQNGFDICVAQISVFTGSKCATLNGLNTFEWMKYRY